ncbi:hypothetical protein LCGC14_0585960 [marine sediment metagenome]|uniref:DUF362 domain-containing protein n=1 Tax=marine sediment metagenome TaxID=412755 RepID=A0A0F9REY8_9ZZZZ
MRDQPNLNNTEVAVVRGETPKESLVNGIELLGGISKFIKKDDQVFIKFNLFLPGGFPNNTNIDVLTEIVLLCKEAGAKKVYLGSFPLKGFTVKVISDTLNLEKYFRSLGAELAFLDNSNLFHNKGFKGEQMTSINNESTLIVTINNKEILVPKIILDSDKIISVNQVSVNPLFRLNLSLLNLFSIVSPKYQELRNQKEHDDNYITQDQYKKDMISEIIGVFGIKQPNLVINDLFYLLEGAGPYIYTESNLKKTNLIVLGKDAVSVDQITLKLLQFDPNNSNLIVKAQKMGFGVNNIQNIKILGEKLEDYEIHIDLCVSALEEINVKNFYVKPGNYCSGCFMQAYHLLNFLKTNIVKDLKYNPSNAFLIGQKPPESQNYINILLYGDCAINSTKNSEFRKIRKMSKKSTIDLTKEKIMKKPKSSKEPKIKFKPNKNILQLPGCPPDFFNCLNLIKKYYGKKNVPNLTFINKILNLLEISNDREKLKSMGVI